MPRHIHAGPSLVVINKPTRAEFSQILPPAETLPDSGALCALKWFIEMKTGYGKGVCAPVFTAALFIAVERQVRLVFVDTHTLEYYSTVRKKEILPFATT